MRIAHAALWTRDLDATASFFRENFNATVGEAYHSRNRPGFVSRFVTLPEGDCQIELMTRTMGRGRPARERGWDHIAIPLGGEAAVDRLAEKCRSKGCLKSGPRWTGDGFYEAVIILPAGGTVEITA